MMTREEYEFNINLCILYKNKVSDEITNGILLDYNQKGITHIDVEEILSRERITPIKKMNKHKVL